MGTNLLRLAPDNWDLMRAHILACLPEEACGLLGGHGGRIRMVLPVLNALRSSARFRMDPEGQLAAMGRIEEEGEEIIGIYHSHPDGPPHPSGTDLLEAAYPEAAQLIWFPSPSGWQCRAFRHTETGFIAMAIEQRPDEPSRGQGGS
ncbi:MAG TPA: M67 family metallopeptidase [Anaerolineales bacterium]|nr:M67 family metallopeptidase [Anaerolineales bacterium]